MTRGLIVIGIIFIIAGIAWPWLSRLGIGHLPGDIRFERKGFSFYAPVTSSIVISLLLSILIWLFRK